MCTLHPITNRVGLTWNVDASVHIPRWSRRGPPGAAAAAEIFFQSFYGSAAVDQNSILSTTETAGVG